jgi:putative SOS response-associated peptidase YedK
VPFWLKPDQLGKQPYSTINARADRVQTAPTYREPFKKRRCLVPASGWYEWQKIDAKTKKPHYFQPAAKPFAFAGVWDVWNGDGKPAPRQRTVVQRRRRCNPCLIRNAKGR